MPNHVTTMITASRDVVFALLREPTAEEIGTHVERHETNAKAYEQRTGKAWPYPFEPLPAQLIDFDLIIPSPPNKEKDGCTGSHEAGIICWHSWNTENWGTKWGGYSHEVKSDDGVTAVLKFDTAWSHPAPILRALSKKFPAERIITVYADEDLGHNLGCYEIIDGIVVQLAEIESGSDEALDLAAMVKYGKSYAELKEEWDEDDEEEE